jgi:MSHA pilin protein MshC
MPELVAVIVIVGILSTIAMARISGGFATTRGFYDQLLSQVQYGRKAAIAQRRPVFVRIDAAQSRLCYSSGGTCTGADGAAAPTGQLPFTVSIPPGVTVTAAIFQFDALGRYRDLTGAATPGPLAIVVVGDVSLQFTVEHDTGYVR